MTFLLYLRYFSTCCSDGRSPSSPQRALSPAKVTALDPSQVSPSRRGQRVLPTEQGLQRGRLPTARFSRPGQRRQRTARVPHSIPGRRCHTVPLQTYLPQGAVLHPPPPTSQHQASVGGIALQLSLASASAAAAAVTAAGPAAWIRTPLSETWMPRDTRLHVPSRDAPRAWTGGGREAEERFNRFYVVGRTIDATTGGLSATVIHRPQTNASPNEKRGPTIYFGRSVHQEYFTPINVVYTFGEECRALASKYVVGPRGPSSDLLVPFALAR